MGPHKRLVTPSLVAEAHRAGLSVAAWTVRLENQFLAEAYRRGNDPHAAGDLDGEVRALFRAGVDAVFTDHPDHAVAVRSSALAAETRSPGTRGDEWLTRDCV